MRIERRIYWNELINVLKSIDPTCGLSGEPDNDGISSFIELRNIDASKESDILNAINAHNADAALAAWNAKKQRQLDASPAIRNMPNWGTWTPQEAEAWIELNVKSLASAKSVLKKLAVAVCYLRDHGGIV